MLMNGDEAAVGLHRGSRSSMSTEATIHEADEEEDDVDADKRSQMSADSTDWRIMQAMQQRTKRSVASLGGLTLTGASLSDPEQGKMLRDLFADFDILLAQRDFERAVDTLLRLKTATSSSSSTSVQQLIYKQKERELIGILRKDLAASKERGNNSKGVAKVFVNKIGLHSLIQRFEELD